MSMESLGGSMLPGRPVAVSAGGRTHVFAMPPGGGMNHWQSSNGIDWTGPDAVFSPGVATSYPSAITLANGIHVLAIGAGGFGSSGGPLLHWFSPDGAFFPPPMSEPAWPIPGGENGLAITSMDGQQLDAFGITTSGLVHYSWDAANKSLGSAPMDPLRLPPSVLAAVSPAPNVMDVFALDLDGSVLRWEGRFGWRRTTLPRPTSAPPGGPLVRSGLAAVSSSPDQIDVFAVTYDGLVTNWSIDQATTRVEHLPAAPWPLPDGVPAAVMTDGHLEVFAIGHPPDPITGGPLVRWRRDRGKWSEPVVINASLAAGGVGATVGSGRIDAFAFNSGSNNSLQHWPAGIRGGWTDDWVNWAANQTSQLMGHCRPTTLEELVAIVQSAEEVPDARVRAVGSSWSFTDVAKTGGYVVETNQLNHVLTHVIDQSILDAHAPAEQYLVHVEAGIQVEQLMNHLDQIELAPFTMGGASGQTLAGVISTSVHGSDWDRGPIPDAVRAIHLVGPGGVQHWIEPDGWRITDRAALQARLGPSVQIHYDDDWFDSAVVSLGALGIVYSYVLEATDQHFLLHKCTETDWSTIRASLTTESFFTNDNIRAVTVAIDAGDTLNRKCFVTTRKYVPIQGNVAFGNAPAPDPLGAFCEIDVMTALVGLVDVSIATAVIVPLVRATFPFFPLPPGLELTPAGIVILIGLLKAAGPGKLGDFVGTILNALPGLTAQLVSTLSQNQSKVGTNVQDFAHKVMCPPNPGECAVRALALELAFDTTYDDHLNFFDQALPILDQMHNNGLILGGWISIRFVGPSRAILSPQQSTRTCMFEAVGIRTLDSTLPILRALEGVGLANNGVQHWGMFTGTSLSARQVTPAHFPRLDTWRRVREQITAGGTIRTFDNSLTLRCGLENSPTGVPTLWQNNWRFCRNCLIMAFGGGPGVCAANGGGHDFSASGDYGFPHSQPSAPGQRDWHWCQSCFGLTLGRAGGACPGPSGVHDVTASGEYTVLRNGQDNWRRCMRCECLFFGGAAGACYAGGNHDIAAVENYWLAYTAPRVAGQKGWQLCDHCKSLYAGTGQCPDGQPHQVRPGPHNAPRFSYTVPLNAPTSPGQPHWRRCMTCETLSYGPGACFGGGKHHHVGSGGYTVRVNAGQNAWRLCKNCQGLWFSLAGQPGACRGARAAGGGHYLGSDDYFVAYR